METIRTKYLGELRTEAEHLKSGQRVFAAMAIIVNIQLDKEAVIRSLGEKASPFPWLSNGASVITLCPDFK